jgi:hypothetical protein
MRTITDFPTPIGENKVDLFTKLEVCPSQDVLQTSALRPVFFDNFAQQQMPQGIPELEFPDG